MKQTTTYGTLRQALVDRKQVLCRYQGYYRELSLHKIGQGVDRTDRVFTFQFAGQTSQGALPPSGEWRCMRVAEIDVIEVRDGPFYSGTSKGIRPQSCVKFIDVEVEDE
jgi:hypothetical protein